MKFLGSDREGSAAPVQRIQASEILGVVAMPENDPARIPVVPGLLTVVANRPASPGNLGVLLRSCSTRSGAGV